jgi:hypothetical protein
MLDAVNLNGLYIGQAQKSELTAVIVQANGLWYLVPVQSGGWALRQLLTGTQVRTSIPTLKQLGEQERQRLWDIVRAPVEEIQP